MSTMLSVGRAFTTSCSRERRTSRGRPFAFCMFLCGSIFLNAFRLCERLGVRIGEAELYWSQACRSGFAGASLSFSSSFNAVEALQDPEFEDLT